MIRWEGRSPFEDLINLQREMTDLFGRAFGGEKEARRRTWGPSMEAFFRGEEGRREFVIRIAVPGVKPEDVDISVRGQALIVRGERKYEEKVEGDDYLFSEIAYGRFERAVTLPQNVDTEKIQAKLNNGVLEITVPLTERAQSRKVEVQAGEGSKPQELTAARAGGQDTTQSTHSQGAQQTSQSYGSHQTRSSQAGKQTSQS
jgi:HSP20 family protein